MIIIWIITSIVLFSIIVLIHEWWHFITARKFWVKVEEFWLWIPPRAKKLFKDKKWTLFSLNWLPIWWFVKLTWEMPNTFYVFDVNKKLHNNESLEKDIKKWNEVFDKEWNKIWKYELEEIFKKLNENNASYNLSNKPSWQQAIIILAWVFMNFVLAWLIFTILFLVWVKPIWINDKIETDLELKIIPTKQQAIESWAIIKNPGVILYPVKWSLAENQWIKKWDKLYEVHTCDSKMLDHVICKSWEKAKIFRINTPEELIKIIKNNSWKNVALLLNTRLLNSKEKNEYNSDYLWWWFRKIKIWENGKIWAYIWEDIIVNKDFEYKFWIIKSMKYWLIETKNQILLTFKWLWILIKKIFNPEKPQEREEAINSLSWPIWIVDFISNSVTAWFVFILIIWAIISINLWVFNLLPIPALDWWRFIFITINWIIKKAFWKKILSEKTEWIIHVWFFILLIALSLIIAYNDLNKIFNN